MCYIRSYDLGQTVKVSEMVLSARIKKTITKVIVIDVSAHRKEFVLMELLDTELPRRKPQVFAVKRCLVLRPNCKQEYIRRWQAAVLPRLQRRKGFITAWTLTSAFSDEITIMSQWETETEYRAWHRSHIRCQVYAHIGGLVSKHVSEEGFYLAGQGI